jgi:hypothetical protein
LDGEILFGITSTFLLTGALVITLGIGFLTPVDGVRGAIGFLGAGFFICAITSCLSS